MKLISVKIRSVITFLGILYCFLYFLIEVIKAISTIKKYERKGLIKMHTWYHADRVSDTREGAGGGNDGRPLLAHIEQTKPKNVIIITDDNIQNCSHVVTVPGAVWILFFDTQSQNLIDHVKGRKLSAHYLITDY